MRCDPALEESALRKRILIIDDEPDTVEFVDYLERIADAATNIAEDVYYLAEGKIIRHRAELAE